MVFTSLGQREKDAFFSLLDEYFASRPEIFASSQSSSEAQDRVAEASSAAASAVRHAVVANPEATARLVSSGLRHFATANSTTPTTGTNRPSSNVAASTSGASEPSEHETPSVAARVAAAQAMFSGKQHPFGKFGSNTPSSSSTTTSAPPPQRVNAVSSSGLAPPPVRRVPSARQTPPAPKEEWVEALYDFVSDEAGDLNLQEGQRVLLLERTSDDWWSGEVNGQKGLFPASYVKAL